MANIDFRYVVEPDILRVGLSPNAYRGDDGKSPYVDEEGYWWEYDDESNEWKNTGILSDKDAAEKALAAAAAANEAKGNVDAAIQAAQEATEQANAAAESAETRTTEAVESAQQTVSDAVESAQQTVSEAVSEAEEKVNTAVTGAEEATKQATDAAAEANKQATAAQEATTQMQEQVEQAVSDAEAATDKATGAATQAETSARLADEAAARANEASVKSGLRKQIVDALPAVSEMVEDVIYSVPAAHPTQDDARDEYWLIDGKVERLGGGTGGINISSAVVELDAPSYPYDGSPHSPKVVSIMLDGKPLKAGSDCVVVSPTATNAGSYETLVIGVVEYTGGVRVPWSIEKAAGGVSLSSEALTVKGVMGTVDTSVTVTRVGDGVLSAESLSPEYATAEIVDGNKVKITSVKAGQARVVVRAAEAANYTAAEHELTVTVEKATGSISVEPSSLEITGNEGTEGTATLNPVGDGTISVSAASNVRVSREGNKLTLTSIAEGSERLTITLSETENYTGASCTLDVLVKFKTPVSDTFSENGMKTIEEVCASGEVPEAWKNGDSKEWLIDGAMCEISIIGKNHDDLDPSDKYYNDPKYNKGSNKAALTLQMKNLGPNKYRMHSSSDNSCSWSGSEMRTTSIPKIEAASDPELLAAVRTVTKCTAQSKSDSTILKTADKFFLLSEVEVFGTLTYSHPGEGTQYAFYAAGNDKIKNFEGSPAWWWLRSPSTYYSNHFRHVNSNGNSNSTSATTSGGLAVGFCV